MGSTRHLHLVLHLYSAIIQGHTNSLSYQLLILHTAFSHAIVGRSRKLKHLIGSSENLTEADDPVATATVRHDAHAAPASATPPTLQPERNVATSEYEWHRRC